MKVRVFIPCAADPAGAATYSAADFNFPVLPEVGHVLRFSNGKTEEYAVAEVGFVQEDAAFLAAVWLESSEREAAYRADLPEAQEPREEYRDLNADVPPETMTGY